MTRKRFPPRWRKLASGNYAIGDYEVIHDIGQGGTGEWVIIHDSPGGADCPTFAKTLRKAATLIEAGKVDRP